MRGPRPMALLGPAALLAAAAAVVLAGMRPAPSPAAPRDADTRAVSPEASGCPAFPVGGGNAATDIDIGAVAPGRAGGARPGELLVGGIGAAVRPLLTVGARGRWQTATVPGEEGGDLVLRSSGGLQSCATAYTGQRLPDDAGGGLAVRRCAAPARQWWFVGAGSSAERESTLVLTNLDEGDTVVDVVLRGVDGRLEAAGTEGIRIGPGDSVVRPLSGLVAGQDEVSIEVEATQGRVVAAVADDWSGIEPVGSEWLPAAAAPGKAVLLTAVVDPGERSRLIVANASDRAVPVEVSLTDDNGTFVPTSAPSVLAPADGVVSIPVPDVGEGAAVLVRAAGPVTAAVRVASAVDVGYAVQGPPLDAPSVAPVDFGRSTDDTDLLLQLAAVLNPGVGSGTSTPPARTATVTAYDDEGARLASAELEIPAGTATLVRPGRDLDLDAPDRRALAYLVVSPGDPAGPAGPLLATTVLRDTDGHLTLVPLDPGVVRVDLPLLVPAVLPRGGTG